MSFITCDQGEIVLLKYMLNFAPADNVVLHLFNNNYTPTTSDTLATYTESSAAGYAPKTLTGAAWTFTNVSGTSTATYARQTFSYTTSENVYGYYITNNAGTVLIWTERFAGAPFQIPNAGGTVSLDPAITLSTS